MYAQCRICRRTDLKNHFPLDHRSGESDRETILDMITFLSGVEGEISDELPQQVCRICRGNLIGAFELKRLCIESDAYFREQLVEAAAAQKRPPELQLQEDTSIVVKMEDALPDASDLESCLTLEHIKMEHDDSRMEEEEQEILEATEFEGVEQMMEGCFQEEQQVQNRITETTDGCVFFCCFPHCGVSYPFEELLVEHATLDHASDRVENAAASGPTAEFICIVCARAFEEEVLLVQHRDSVKLNVLFKCLSCNFKTNSKPYYQQHIRDHSRNARLCDCGFRTKKTYIFKRHQTVCSVVKAVEDPNKFNFELTNEEMIALGYTLRRENKSSSFHCCAPTCGNFCDTQQQVDEHFLEEHSAQRLENASHSSTSSSPFRCETCLVGFETSKRLQIHREDTLGPTFQCQVCLVCIPSRKAAILHKKKPCFAKEFFKCKCGLVTNRKYSLERHWRVKGCQQFKFGPPRPYEISKPRRGKSKVTKVSKPAVSRSKDKETYVCDMCNTVQKTATRLRMHKDQELTLALVRQTQQDPGEFLDGSDRKTYTCRWCGERTDSNDHLVRCMLKFHKDSSTGADGGAIPENFTHRCSKCQAGFVTEQELQQHTGRKECALEGFSCLYCRTQWASAKLREEHTMAMHSKVSDQFTCCICGLLVKNAFSLNRHMKTHMKDSAKYRLERCGEQ